MLQVPDNIYYVSNNFNDVIPMHEFSTLQAAIDQVPDYGRAKIIILDSLMNIPEIKFPHIRTNIMIDGGNFAGIYFAPGIMFNLPERTTLKFRDMTYIRGDKFTIDNLGTNIGFYNCQSVLCSITLESGQYSNLYIHDTKFYGVYDNPAIKINNEDVKVELFNSYIKGGYNHPAIMFNNNSECKVKIKGTLILHGSGEYQPIQRNGDFKPSVYLYDSQSNVQICDASITNWIVDEKNIKNISIF